MNIEDILKNKKNINPEEFADILDIARAGGLTTFVTMIDDPDSPEGKNATEYIDSHYLLPKNYKDTTELEIEEKGTKLLHPETPISEKKEIIMLLAHLGIYESYKILKKYHQNPDAELRVWANMAFDECRTFVHQNLSEDVLLSLSLIEILKNLA